MNLPATQPHRLKILVLKFCVKHISLTIGSIQDIEIPNLYYSLQLQVKFFPTILEHPSIYKTGLAVQMFPNNL